MWQPASLGRLDLARPIFLEGFQRLSGCLLGAIHEYSGSLVGNLYYDYSCLDITKNDAFELPD